LDVGCGTGVQLQRYAAAGCVVAGVDLSPAMLARAEHRLGGGADLQLGSAEHLPYATASFDLVLATLMLHELSAGQRDAVAREMLRVVAPGGKLLITDFHPGPWSFPKGWAYRAVSVIAESIARHLDRSRAFLADGGVPALAERLGATIERTKIVAGGNLGLYVLEP
jgi:ubiquinone/menaquinone biosynthesis C-methylase UbiE